MVGICGCNNRCICNYTVNRKLPGNKGGVDKPGEEFKNGIKPHFLMSKIRMKNPFLMRNSNRSIV
jgi:hypothetical protein